MHIAYRYWTGLALVFVLGLLVGLPAARAQQAEMFLSADSVRVGDRFFLTLMAVHRSEDALLMSANSEAASFGDLVILREVSAGSRTLNPGGSGLQVDSIRYEVTTFALDSAYVPPLPLVVSAGDTLYTASYHLPIISLVPADAQDILDITPLIGFPRSVWFYVGIGMGVLALVALLYYLWWRRRNQPAAPPPAKEEAPPPSPYETALARLAILEHNALPEAAHIKPFYVELSEILRTYLEQCLKVPALECTTHELIRELDRTKIRHRLPSGSSQRIHELLKLADLVKFADMKPSESLSQEALEKTRTMVEAIEQKQRQLAADRERTTLQAPTQPAA